LYLLGIAVANGVEALGVDYHGANPLKGNVLYLALEDGQRRLQRRMTKLIGAQPENWPKDLDLKTEWRRFDEGGLDDIRAWHQSVKDQGGNPTLIMIDTLAKVRAPGSPKASPYQNDHDALAGLQKLTDELGLFIIISHHDRKMDADDVHDTVSGTLGLTGAVDTILILTKKRDVRTLHVRGRDIEEDAALEMKFGKDCRWSVVGTVAARQEALQSEQRTRVLNALANGELCLADIVAVAELQNTNAAKALLYRMTQDGEVERIRRGLYGLPHEKVTPDAEQRYQRYQVTSDDKALKLQGDKDRSNEVTQVTRPHSLVTNEPLSANGGGS
jgi:AAA domain